MQSATVYHSDCTALPEGSSDAAAERACMPSRQTSMERQYSPRPLATVTDSLGDSKSGSKNLWPLH